MTKLFVVWSHFGMWMNEKLLLIPSFDPCDKFTMSAVLLWFMLFWRKIILSRFMHFRVEQKLTHKSCPWSTNDKYDVWVWVYSEKRDPGQGAPSPPAYTLEAPNNSSRLHPSFPDAHTKRGCLRRKRGRQCWLAIVLDLTWLNLTSIRDTHCG